MNRTKTGLALLSTTILLTGCMSYQAAKLTPIHSDIGIQQLVESGSLPITVAWKVFDKADCKHFLGRNVLEEGFAPIQLTIYNDSDHPLYFDPADLSVPSVTPDKVIRKVQTSKILIGATQALTGDVHLSYANKKLDDDFTAKSAIEGVIQPNTIFNGLIFVKAQDANAPLEVRLIDRKTNQKLVFSGVAEYKTGFAVAHPQVKMDPLLGDQAIAEANEVAPVSALQ